MNADISAKTSDDKHALDKNSLPLCTASVGGDDYGIPPLVDVLFDPFYDSRLCVQIIDRDVKEALQMHSGYSILGNHGNSSDWHHTVKQNFSQIEDFCDCALSIITFEVTASQRDWSAFAENRPSAVLYNMPDCKKCPGKRFQFYSTLNSYQNLKIMRGQLQLIRGSMGSAFSTNLKEH